jgi:hypothetical protein
MSIAATAMAGEPADLVKSVTRKDGERMAARSACDDDLEMLLLAHAARVAGSLLEAAKTASRRGGSLSRRLFVHVMRFTRASHFDLPKQRGRMLLARFLEIRRFVAVGFLAAAVVAAPVRAERPIVDLHRLDAYFELFAADSSVPWKPTAVRLDTYSSAPVAFSVYQIDPADVLTAGSNFSPRAIVTSGRRPALSFNFTPPGGYQFQSNEVGVPLGSREGFFVVEARRGNVGEQVWINRSRVGLVVKQTPSGLLLYGADLGTGAPLARMRVQFVVNRSFATMTTDDEGVVRWNRAARPVFALAQWGSSYAFLNLLPQAPLPSTIVGVRTESAVVHAGDSVRVIGFARTRVRGVLRASTGSAVVTLRSGATAIAERRVPLDDAGAFATSFAVPENAAAGEYAVLAQAAGGVGGASLDVDSNSGGLSLQVNAACGGSCDPQQDLPLLIHSSRGGETVRVTVVRSPHVYVGDAPENVPWATAQWFDGTLRTGDDGSATLRIPHPNDELASTYGVHVAAGGATADTRVSVPTAQAAIRVTVDRAEQGPATPIGFDVYADSLDGKPLAGAQATITIAHGASVGEQRLTLDGNGHARGSFSSPDLGTNFLFAFVDRGGRAADAASVRVDPQAPQAATDGGSANVRVTLDRQSYRAGEEVNIAAAAPGSHGDALITLESSQGVETRVVRSSGGAAAARLSCVNAAGELRVGAAFVRDGAIEWTTVPLALSGPGRPHAAALALGSEEFAPGGAAKIGFDGASSGSGTFVVRISKGSPSGSALFTSAPALLVVGVTATQNSAVGAATWHPWVNSTGEHAQVLGFVRRTGPPRELSLAQAETDAISWSVARSNGGPLAVALPDRSGRYELSVLDISDDGSVSAGSSTIVVR